LPTSTQSEGLIAPSPLSIPVKVLGPCSCQAEDDHIQLFIIQIILNILQLPKHFSWVDLLSYRFVFNIIILGGEISNLENFRALEDSILVTATMYMDIISKSNKCFFIALKVVKNFSKSNKTTGSFNLYGNYIHTERFAYF
jgi:hypothetical protein